MPLKLLPITVANADIKSLKYLNALFNKYLDHIVVKFEQNSKVETTWNFELFDKNPDFLKPFWGHFGRRFCNWNDW